MARLRTGKIARHQRVPRDRPLYFKEWEIPAGVSIHVQGEYPRVPGSHFSSSMAFPPYPSLPLGWRTLTLRRLFVA